VTEDELPAPSPPPSPTKRRPRWRAIGGVIFVLIALAALLVTLHAQRKEIGDAIDELSWTAIVGAEIALLIGVTTSMLAWRTILAGLGHKLHHTDAGRIFFVGQLGKYLPGSVWPVLMQMEMGVALNVPRATMFWATAVAMMLAVVTGALVGIVAVPALLTHGGAAYMLVLVAVPLGLTLLYPPVLNRLLAFAMRVLRRPPLDQELTGPVLLRASLFTFATWLANGLHVYILAASISGGSAKLLALSIGGYALAWVAGFLVVISPAGLGVRDTLLALCLGAAISAGAASAVALVSRLLVTLADGIVAGVALLSYAARRHTRARASRQAGAAR